ncbi:uncharacterized protein MELLADRAFT_104226 [Melampsora larici-populina 98AG31]|uniref:NUDE domain-containing protein n=1 Tax=Melampsora larici-populina (strain 98AG31 / pathotype 3-4-7) TaxID=747676 RepID=F4RE04_MELLP|nr:uncharacterized protein MELLADRAFT_104226 [Melampsora larici-populina 98AG31]EGG09497.1 hypothetical protein MELLADRAFT_104226 [Melampsora larici-populina 98AG31]
MDQPKFAKCLTFPAQSLVELTLAFPLCSFESDHEALDHYRNLAKNLQYDLDDTRTALEEFQTSSKELEAELEKDLATTEKQLNELRGREENLTHEVDQWKTKYQSALRDHTKTMTHMQAELDSLRTSNEEYRTRLRDMELDNDELEGKERMVTSSLQDVESKYGKAIERITLLEDELIEHTRLEEECQRLRDDMRDLTEEMGVMRDQLATLQVTNPVDLPVQPQPLTPSTAPLSESASPYSSPRSKDRTLSERSLKLSRSPRHLSRSPACKSSPQTAQVQLLADQNAVTPRRRLISLSVNASEIKSPTAIPRSLTSMTLTKSSSLRISRRSTELKATLHEVLAPNSRIPAPGQSPSSLGKSVLRRDGNPTTTMKASKTPTTNENVNTRNSHLQFLRAETQRMQGMTQKLVSSRTSRLVSAIPVPKASLLASAYKNPSTALTASTRVPVSKSPTKKPSIGHGLSAYRNPVRNFTQPPTQDQDPSEGQTTRVPRKSHAAVPVPSKTRIARPSSRLSDHQSSQPPNNSKTRIARPSSRLSDHHPPSRSVTPAYGVARRKPSIDSSNPTSRPASSLGHIRRKSTALNSLHFSKPDNLMTEDFVNSNIRKPQLLGKSLGPGAFRSRPPAPIT